ncbi:hypothetical protein BGI41_01740 [Methanobrevibacter sp. 87.7]|uniref:tetratricopeptide repeat protein n=1 Tax=Methanobrevibacter sp. 87.7 TaxID=387957 RepID=UPI000B500F98|nr:hypothetical protein [Methanobrevibacter sp. 87.7]OWT33576.1 hypothetical protein BGI41_01740 [Methanobrevibacter sp. 87.7]
MSNLDDIFNKASSKKSKKEDDTQLTFSTNLDDNSSDDNNDLDYVSSGDSGSFDCDLDSIIVNDSLESNSKEDITSFDNNINLNSNNIEDDFGSFDDNLDSVSSNNSNESLNKDIKLKNKIDKIFVELDSELDDDFQLNIEKAKVLANVEDYDEAIKFLDLSLSIKEDINVLYTKAKYLHELNKDKESLEIINKILKLDENCFNALKLKVTLLCNLKEYDLADTTFNKAISVNPEDYEIWQQYADIFDSLNNQEKALKINDLALKKFPNELDLLYDRRYYLINGGYDESEIDDLNNTINTLESTADDPDYSSGVVNIEEAELELEPNITVGSKGYEDNDSKDSDDNDIYDLDSEDKHYDDEENLVDLNYDEDFENVEDTEEEDFKKKLNKTKELTLDNFF